MSVIVPSWAFPILRFSTLTGLDGCQLLAKLHPRQEYLVWALISSRTTTQSQCYKQWQSFWHLSRKVDQLPVYSRICSAGRGHLSARAESRYRRLLLHGKLAHEALARRSSPARIQKKQLVDYRHRLLIDRSLPVRSCWTNWPTTIEYQHLSVMLNQISIEYKEKVSS